MQAIAGERRIATKVVSAMLATLLFAFGLIAATTTAATAATMNLTGGTLNWGIKESFRNYVSGPIAGGGWSTAGGASDSPSPFVFSGGTGTYDTDTHQTVVSFNGAVAFSGHGGQLDMSFTNPRVTINADGTGTVVVDAQSAPIGGAPVPYDDVTVATISGASPTITGATVSVTAPIVTLTDAGAPAFGGFYAAGTDLDALTFAATVEAPPTTEPPVTDPPITDPPVTDPPVIDPPATNPPATDPPAVNQPPAADSSTVPVADGSPVTPSPANKCVANEVSSGSISWGIKSSFRNYISSAIAHGGWTLSNATYADGAFVWSAGDGSFNAEAKSGTISGNGTVTFTGHDGLLNLTIANPRLAVNGGSGTLYADVTSTDMEGNPAVNASGVAFATVNTDALAVSGSTVSLNGAAVTLTADGAAAFASFYQAGTELDPISVTAQLGGEVECSSAAGTAVAGAAGGANGAGGKLADTGASIAVPAAIALVALLAGGALIWSGRRTTA